MSDDQIDYVALTITGESLDPLSVTLKLGVEPSRSFARGDLTVHPQPTSFGYWRFRINRPAGELNNFLDALLGAFSGKEEQIAELAEQYEVTVTVVSDLTGFSEGELDISSSVLSRLAVIKAELRFYWLYDIPE